MSYNVKPGNIFGRVGKGIGQGLAEQMPKEIERNRLASGLERFGQEGANQPPTQQIAELLRSGVSQENIGQLYPIIREAQQRQAFQDQNKQPQAKETLTPQHRGEIPLTIKQASGGSQPTEERKTQETNKSALAPASEIKRYKESVRQLPTANEINELASEFLNSGIAQNVPQAKQLAQQELSQNLQAQQQRLGEFSQGLENRITNDLQKSGFDQFKDVAGEIKNALLDQGNYLVGEKGLTPEAAQQEIGDIIKELGKTATQTKATGALSNWFKPSSEKTRELRDQKKQFEKYGFGEIFDDMASSSLGTTPMQTAAILDPLKNKEIDSAISSVKPSKFVDVENLDPKKMDQIIKSIKPKDNLLSIAEKLRDKKVNIEQFLSRLSELEDEGEIALTPQQIRQRNKPATNSVFGDILFKLF